MHIKVSARLLLDVLARKISLDDFHRRTRDVFDNLEGLTIKSARLERAPDDDDDWVIFDLEGDDPAVSPIVNPLIKG
jgi:hypothetical protein